MVTIDDVAQRAGVATSTVSYALSGKRPISEATRQRIEQAIADLGYRRHAGAKALASAHTDVIGLVAPLRVGVNVNVIMEFVAGVVAGASSSGYDILLLTQEAGVLDRVVGSSMVDAVIVMDIEDTDPRVPELVALGRPTVLIGIPAAPAGLSCIDLDFRQAGVEAARHLASLGHRKLALLGSPSQVMARHTSYAERMTSGFTSGCDEVGAEYLVIPTDSSVKGARTAVDRLFNEFPEVTGIVVHNEAALPHTISALRDRGIKLPEDLSLIAVCPESTALSQAVPITSIAIPAESIGRTAVEMLTAMIDHERLAEVRLITPRLVDRASTGKPRRSAVS